MTDLSVLIDTREITITPLFRYESIEDINASERAGHLVKKMRQVVEVRFAGSKNYSPVFPVDAMWKRENGKEITFAERWADQYRAFLDGSNQEAAGTPLEMLKNYGISDANLSLCRALRIYSIEALFHLESDALKSLGMAGNALKEMARSYMAARDRGNANVDEVERLKAELAALKASMIVPAKEASPAQIDAAIEASDTEFQAMDDDALKDWIAGKTGAGRPRGNPSHETLVSMARELSNA
ncbi:hypothetical protein [Mesorhizobium sp. BE184]|uniref:hypothetical protein n=1 Tax=Mesorhizobium sp. BE184 TaxID=2817714 RepID=UPI00285C0D90|nr:hypothetical protein [Mesorhizobium sp. BE184]MDR7032432.1 hypothetical protein [Mesorhizobium sp. BE184]